jgi:phosphoesterase RecJ-like protein
MTAATATASREQILRELRDADRFILVTHENPDGDALGSLVAMNEVLGRLGKDSLMFMAADEFPLPYEYRFFLLDGLISVPPEDVEERTIVFLDCGNIDRNPADSTSTTTTTTPTSAPWTTSCPRRRARRRSCGT